MVSSSPPVERLKHRAGPVEIERDRQGKKRKVQRCLRCDSLVSVKDLDDEFPRVVGSFVKVGNVRCSGEM